MFRRVGAVLAVAGILATGIIGTASSASAATLGPGHGDLGTVGVLGSFVSESDGRQVYCIDAGAPGPWGTTTGPTTVTDLVSHTGAQLSGTELAKLNYVLARWGDSPDPDVTAAVQLFVWSVADPVTYNSHGMSGDDWYIGRVPTGNRATVLGNLATMRAEAEANHAVNPSVDVTIAATDQYNATLTVTVSPATLTGNVVLQNATFTDGTTSKPLSSGTYPIIGTPPAGAPDYQIIASASYGSAGVGARVNLYETPGSQRLIANGTSTAVTAQARTPVIPLDFQPVIGTQVAARYVDEGDAFVDRVTVSTVGTGEWIIVDGTPVELTATGTLYGPFDEQPTEADTAPDGAPVAGTETLTLTGTGEYLSAGTVTATITGDVPDGAYLVFRAYGPHTEQPATGQEGDAFFTSDPIPVSGPGEYESGSTTVDAAGLVFWVETLHASDGTVLAEGFIGAPGETTIVRERPADVHVSTRAVAEVVFGEPAHDVAIVTATVPDGATLTFHAYRQTGEQAVCEPGNLVFDTAAQPIPVTRPGEYASTEVVFEQVGVYFWVETLHDAEGEVLHRGTCGAQDETTTVIDAPTVPTAGPSGPTVLAATGGGWTWAGLLAGLGLLATGGTLWFGRRLALYRESTGYVRDEDRAWHELTTKTGDEGTPG
ncbi:hypothetical protein [Microbacterium lacticum]